MHSLTGRTEVASGRRQQVHWMAGNAKERCRCFISIAQDLSSFDASQCAAKHAKRGVSCTLHTALCSLLSFEQQASGCERKMTETPSACLQPAALGVLMCSPYLVDQQTSRRPTWAAHGGLDPASPQTPQQACCSMHTLLCRLDSNALLAG